MHLHKTKRNGALNQYTTFIGLLLFFSLLFFLQPFFTFVLLAVIGLLSGAKSSRFLSLVAFFGACYLGLINATKLPESDYAIYLEWYSNAKELSLPGFLAINAREPLFYIYLHTIANLSYSSEKLFVFISTVISYLVFTFGVIRASIGIGLQNRVIVAILVALLFFAPLFSLSAHLMRQFIAASLVILFFSEILSSDKKHWWILIAAILMHYSAIIFLPLAMIRKINRTSSVISLFIYLSLLPLIYLAAKSAAHLFSEMPVIGFVFDRIAAEEGHDLGHLNFASIFFVMAAIVLSGWNLIASRRTVNATISDSGWRINAAIIILGLIVLVANLQDGTTEIAKRFFFYLYFFMGLSIPMFVALRRKSVMFLFPVIMLLLPYFFFNLQFGVWQYAPLPDLLFAPAWELWTHRI